MVTAPRHGARFVLTILFARFLVKTGFDFQGDQYFDGSESH